MSVRNFLYYSVLGLFRKKDTSLNDFIKCIKQIKSPVLLEAGAANGYDTLKLSKAMPNAMIYAFEPVSRSFKMLEKRVKNRRNVKYYNLALGKSDGKDFIYLSKNEKEFNDIAASSSLLKPNDSMREIFPDLSFEEKEEVNIKTIDSWAKENGVDHIDAMWLDMQGLELDTLKASPIIMETVKVIYTEVNIKEIYKGSGLYDDYKSWMLSLGFKVIKEDITDIQGNVLFFR